MVFIRFFTHPTTKRGVLSVSVAAASGLLYNHHHYNNNVYENNSNNRDTSRNMLTGRVSVLLDQENDDPEYVPQHLFDNKPWNWNWDGKHGQQSIGKRTLIFVRHGQYVHAKIDEDRKLTELGREQAKLTGQRLNELFPNDKIKKIIYSTMTRATETSDIIRKELPDTIPAEPSDLIREGCVYRPIPAHPAWKPTENDFDLDGERIEQAFKTFMHRRSANNDNVNNNSKIINNNSNDEEDITLFVCHGNVIRYFFMNSLQLPKAAWLRTSVANGSITILKIYEDGTVHSNLFAGSGHFPNDKITFN